MPKKVKTLVTPNLDQPLTPELLGEAIKAKRTQGHLRLEDAALLCGVAKQTLMRIEHGEPNSQFGTVLQICDQLGIKLSILPWVENNHEHDEWF